MSISNVSPAETWTHSPCLNTPCSSTTPPTMLWTRQKCRQVDSVPAASKLHGVPNTHRQAPDLACSPNNPPTDPSRAHLVRPGSLSLLFNDDANVGDGSTRDTTVLQTIFAMVGTEQPSHVYTRHKLQWLTIVPKHRVVTHSEWPKTLPLDSYTRIMDAAGTKTPPEDKKYRSS